MTQPIQETNEPRQISGLDYRTRQLARRPATSGCCPAWMAVFDDQPYGQEIDTADGVTALEYPYCDWSENAAGIFDYVRYVGSISDNAYRIELQVSGVYTFTMMEICEEAIGSNYGIRCYINFESARIPGWAANDVTDQLIQVLDFQDGAGTERDINTNFYWLRSATFPVQLNVETAPSEVYAQMVLVKPATPAAAIQRTFRNWLWIVYHGPLQHAGLFSAGTHEYYDPYGDGSDPIHPPDHSV